MIIKIKLESFTWKILRVLTQGKRAMNFKSLNKKDPTTSKVLFMLLLRHESCIECLMQDHAKYLHQPVESPDLINVADPINGIRKKITKPNKLGKKKIIWWMPYAKN